jgi:hypothetical protein
MGHRSPQDRHDWLLGGGRIGGAGGGLL